MKYTTQTPGSRPIHTWTPYVEATAQTQLDNLAQLPFIHHHGVAVMPDVHAGIGSTVGTVIATEKAIIPAAVGVDIGCGMNALRTSLRAEDLPDSLAQLRHDIERGVPLGAGGHHNQPAQNLTSVPTVHPMLGEILPKIAGAGDVTAFRQKVAAQLGSLGSGNHFIELCLDENGDVWVMLHSGSRGIGNKIGRHFIELAKRRMEEYFITLPDQDLAYFPDSSTDFKEYTLAVHWAQEYAWQNRQRMMETVLRALHHSVKPFEVTHEAVNCHHNYVELENHYGKNVYVTRKGAIRARKNELGVIPGSMGAKSFIVRGLGNPESYHSCSHGAGRKMSRKQAERTFTVEDLKQQTEGIECRKDAGVVDEIPGAYKDVDVVMAQQSDLVEIVHTLKQVLCIKGN